MQKTTYKTVSCLGCGKRNTPAMERILELEAEIEHLHAALTTKDSDIAGFEIRIQSYKDIIAAKDSVLSQFANSENWEYDPPLADESFPLWAWTGDANPVQLANQALSEGKE